MIGRRIAFLTGVAAVCLLVTDYLSLSFTTSDQPTSLPVATAGPSVTGSRFSASGNAGADSNANSVMATAGPSGTSSQAAASGTTAPDTTARSSGSTVNISGSSNQVPQGSPQGAPQGSPQPGYFHLNGTTIIAPSGQAYIPLGVTVFGLSEPSWPSMVSSDISQIDASAGFWHANIVRLQVAPYFVDNNAPGYLAALQQEIGRAESDGLNVIISAQYERTNSSLTDHLAGPDTSTLLFWQAIAPLYASDPHVWFELFNEPTADRPYAIWRNGGTGIDGRAYVGMQQLVDAIRNVAPNNMIVAE